MLTPRTAPLVLVPQTALLLALGLVLGWGATAWLAALLSVVVLDAATAHLARRTSAENFGPADLVTLLRATLTCGVVALVVEAFVSSSVDPSHRSTAVAGLAAVALGLDLVDGWVARRTGTESPFGARFDGEADAALMLVLSTWVAPAIGWWVLAIGLARYVFAAARLLLPRLRAPLPPRAWRKVVAASAGTALTVAAAGVLPTTIMGVLLGGALLLLAESFGRDTWWLWRHRSAPEAAVPAGRHPW